MAFQKDMMGIGLPAAQAQAVTGAPMELAKTATGSTQADAYALTRPITEFTTTASGTGAVLPGTSGPATQGDTLLVVNLGANTLTVYPPVGGKINAGSTNAGVSVTTLKTALFVCKGTLDYYAVLSA